MILANCKGEEKRHAQFDCKYLVNGKRWQTFLLSSNRKSYIGVQLAYVQLTFSYSKGQDHFDGEYLGNDDG